MSVQVALSERIYPDFADKKDVFLKVFAKEMKRRKYKIKISKESGFDLIYSDFFGEAKIYAKEDNGLLRFGYKLSVSFLLFAFAAIFPIFDLMYVIFSAGIVLVWMIKIINIRSTINNCAENAYVIVGSKNYLPEEGEEASESR